MSTVRLGTLVLITLAACSETSESELTELQSCDSGAQVTDPHQHLWRVKVGEARMSYQRDEVDLKIDEGIGIQLVYKGRGANPRRSGQADYTERTSYKEVWADRGKMEFVGEYHEYMGDRYSLEVLESANDGRIEVWSDGWIWDNHLFSCYIRPNAGQPGIPTSVLVDNRNANFGQVTPTPLVLEGDDFQCYSAETNQPTEGPVFTRVELLFYSEPALPDTLAIKPEASTPADKEACRMDSAYAYDWDVYVGSFEVSGENLPPASTQSVAMTARVQPASGQAQEYTTYSTPGELRWSLGERLAFERPLQYEELSCVSGKPEDCAHTLGFDLKSADGQVTYASGCKFTVDPSQIIESGNQALQYVGNGGYEQDAFFAVEVQAGAGIACTHDDGLYRGANREPLPMTLAFVPHLKTVAAAPVLKIPDGSGGGGGGGGGGNNNPGTDGDGDGVGDGDDNCPAVDNALQTNTDGDDKGDACDDDDDGDAVADGTDNCPLAGNADQKDTDTDAKGDACDEDDDGDGVLDGNDNCPLVANAGQENADGDDVGDACDQPTDPADGDADGKPDDADNCPDQANDDQKNSDTDPLGDACDPDDDDDKVADADDICPTAFDPDQKDVDSDGTGDECDDDADGDGVPNQDDNCPLVSNADQADKDGDHVGDACPGGGGDDDGGGGGSGGDDDERDFDHDGVGDDSDNCVSISNPDQYDSDGDQLGDACDDPGDSDKADEAGATAGCSAGGGRAGSGAALLLLLAALVLLRRRR